MTWDTLFAMLGTGGLVAFIDWLIKLKVTRKKVYWIKTKYPGSWLIVIMKQY